jgi:Zn-dependent protease with chaperone function
MIAGIVIAVTVLLAISLPHLLPLDHVAPRSASVLWLLALALRALVSVATAIFVLRYVPQAELLGAFANWCFHAALPVVTTHLGLSGHGMVHLAVVIPGLALAASLLWALAGLLRAAVALRLRLGPRGNRPGPLGSTVVADPEVLVALPVLGPARLVISERALRSLDTGEIAASVAHELGHLRRSHRPLLVAAAVLGPLARALPGTRLVESEIRFHLERDADAFAVGLTRDPLSLASAICKAVSSRVRVAVAALGGGGRVGVRLEYLLNGDTDGAVRRLEWPVRGAGVILAGLLTSLVIALPGWALTGPADLGIGAVATASAECHQPNAQVRSSNSTAFRAGDLALREAVLLGRA